MISAVAFAFVLVMLSAFLVFTHVSKWNDLRVADLKPERIEFGRRQFRRRLFGSLLIGLAGLACLASPWMIDPRQSEFWWYWSGLLVIVALLGALAIVDAWDTYRYFRSVQRLLSTQRHEAIAVAMRDDKE